MVPPEDIEKMARAVLDIQLPRSPDQIRSMINNINNLLSNTSNFQDNLSNLEEHAMMGQDLLQKSQELKSVSENMTEHSPCVGSVKPKTLKYYTQTETQSHGETCVSCF